MRLSIISIGKQYLLLPLFLVIGMAAKANIEVKSPSGTLTLTVGIKDNKPFYSVAKGSHDVIKHSALGVRYGDVCLFDFDGVTNDKT